MTMDEKWMRKEVFKQQVFTNPKRFSHIVALPIKGSTSSSSKTQKKWDQHKLNIVLSKPVQNDQNLGQKTKVFKQPTTNSKDQRKDDL
ncbi:hypothetical protein GIB67_038308 [Kingdonia uniflora]|uniref:Uncharacterized protein n=1 Tax=Kingdonia uniflora TaxID=39325 RepID=A0A7J7KUL6_9MAGN|nr:hypothetical protein GIB67_038308 [Kingdonia uniflora]